MSQVVGKQDQIGIFEMRSKIIVVIAIVLVGGFCFRLEEGTVAVDLPECYRGI